ncbi:MAG: hypothetical protein COA66_05070 [Arcobacter sp.]|nr:MAG: hypothetical protein COA66_05070 [Arcobacter sp.]
MDYYLLLIFFIILELFESTWQKSPDLYSYLNKNHFLFSKNLSLYLFSHASFFYSIFLSIYLHNFTFFMSAIILIKFFDIVFKLSIMKKISQGNEVCDIIPMNIKMGITFRYMNVLLYPLFFFIATILQ